MTFVPLSRLSVGIHHTKCRENCPGSGQDFGALFTAPVSRLCIMCLGVHDDLPDHDLLESTFKIKRPRAWSTFGKNHDIFHLSPAYKGERLTIGDLL